MQLEHDRVACSWSLTGWHAAGAWPGGMQLEHDRVACSWSMAGWSGGMQLEHGQVACSRGMAGWRERENEAGGSSAH